MINVQVFPGRWPTSKQHDDKEARVLDIPWQTQNLIVANSSQVTPVV